MYNLCEQKVVRIIPHDTQLQHIVHFILFLRRFVHVLKYKCSNDSLFVSSVKIHEDRSYHAVMHNVVKCFLLCLYIFGYLL